MPTLTDAFVNLADQDDTTRITRFKTVSPNTTPGSTETPGLPPILHVHFSSVLQAAHTFQIWCQMINSQGNVDAQGSGSSGSLPSGFSSYYIPLSGDYCAYYIAHYRLVITLDGQTVLSSVEYDVYNQYTQP